MADVSITLGVDGKALTSGLNQARQQVETFGKRTSAVLSGRGGGGMGGMQKGGMGMLAMQTQDIAVQAQMGTNALQIFAQQGSQIASIFGEKGAIVGGVAAIAGALVYAGQKGNEMFSALIASSQTFSNELGKTLASGSVSQLADMFGAVAQKQAEVQAETEGLGSSFMSLGKGIMGTFTGGLSMSERRAQLAATEVGLESVRATILRETLDLAGQELKVQLAKLSGNSEEAADLERELNLRQKIFSIRQSSLPTAAQDTLIENAKALAAAETRAAAAAKNADVSRARSAARAGLNEARKAVELFGETDEQALNRLLQERDALQLSVSAARGDEVKQIEAATRLAQTELKILETKKNIATATASEMKKQADEADKINKAAQQAKQAAQTKVESQKNFAQSLEDEVKILEAKATGDEDAIKKAEREVEIKNRAREIQQQLGKNAKEALDIAERMQALQEAANEAAEGKGKKEGRIQGYSQERQGGRDEARARADQRMNEARERIGKSRERGFGGLKEFYENQTNPNFARPQTPMLDASRLRPVQSSSDNNASVTVLTELKTLTERMTKAVESIAVV
jgi:hypothetical protein